MDLIPPGEILRISNGAVLRIDRTAVRCKGGLLDAGAAALDENNQHDDEQNASNDANQ